MSASFIAGLAMVGTAIAQERREQSSGPGLVLGILAGIAVLPLFMGSGKYTTILVSKRLDSSGDLFPSSDEWIRHGSYIYTIARNGDPLWVFARDLAQTNPRFVVSFSPRNAMVVRIGVIYPHSNALETRFRSEGRTSQTWTRSEMLRRMASEGLAPGIVQAAERAL